MEKGRVCVTGGTGYVASWLIKKLLQHGYSVNATVRPHRSGMKKDLSFLLNLPGARGRLRFFDADFENPESFEPAIEGCVGVFHVAHPKYLNGEESEETVTKRCIEATLSILKTSLKSKTVKKVVYTSSLAAVMARGKIPPVINEEVWSDVDFLSKSSFTTGRYYCVSKTETERAALEFADKNPIELVTLVPSWIHGPFVCPNLSGSVHSSLALFLGNENRLKYKKVIPMVHVDDVASAHVFLFECGEAKGRYLCSALEVKYDDLCEFLRRRYPQLEMLSPESLCDGAIEFNGISSTKLLDAGFKYEYGLEEVYDEAIECCKEKGFL